MKVTGSKKERLHQAVEGIRSNVEHDFTFGPVDLHDREAINL
jgi:hypothetical protein